MNAGQSQPKLKLEGLLIGGVVSILPADFPGFLILLLGALAWGFGRGLLAARKKWKAIIKKAAPRLGLELVKTRGLFALRAEGKRRGGYVIIYMPPQWVRRRNTPYAKESEEKELAATRRRLRKLERDGSESDWHTDRARRKKTKAPRVRIEVKTELPSFLRFGPPSLFSGRPESGDPEFDQKVVVAGGELELAARLDHDTRQRLISFVQRGSLASGVLSLDMDLDEANNKTLASKTREVLALARALAGEGRSLEARLLDIAIDDPVDGVRERCRKLIFTHTKTSQLRRRLVDAILLEAGGGDEEAVILMLYGTILDQYAAITWLADEGTVLAVPELSRMQDRDVEDDVRARASSAIGHIQLRLKGAGAGQLTVSEGPDTGAVSLTDEGELTLLE